MVPSCSSEAVCIASPRSATSEAASAKLSAPEAARAEYSPRLWPACALGEMPTRSQSVQGDEGSEECGQLRIARLAEHIGIGAHEQVR